MKLTQADEARLNKAHPDLAKVVRLCAKTTPVPFRVGETTRSVEQQRENIRKGVSWTMRSRHLPGKDGLARAVDLIAMPGGKVSWAWGPYRDLAKAMKAAAKQLGVPLEWGGDWKRTPDGPHFQLPWKDYS